MGADVGGSPVTPDDWDAVRIGEPARRALRSAGLASFADLARVTLAEVVKHHVMGPKALNVLAEEIVRRGIGFAAP